MQFLQFFLLCMRECNLICLGTQLGFLIDLLSRAGGSYKFKYKE